MDQELTKKCPYCAEEIKSDATVCRFCTRDLLKFEVDKTMIKEVRGGRLILNLIPLAIILYGSYLVFSGLGMGQQGMFKILIGFIIVLPIGTIWLLLNGIRIGLKRGYLDFKKHKQRIVDVEKQNK